MSEPQAYLDGYRQVADLSGNDRTTREVLVKAVDPVSGVQTEVVEGRADPFGKLPIARPDEETVIANILVTEPRSRVTRRGDLGTPANQPGHSTVIASGKPGRPFPDDNGVLN